MTIDWWKHVVPWLEVLGVMVAIGVSACGVGN
jgi:hypothetical protein